VEACRKAGSPVRLYTYEQRDKGHSIWISGSNPHKLHPDIEAAMAQFVTTLEKRTERKEK
jgi:hypothetical protein